jgi:hypothetical protein
VDVSTPQDQPYGARVFTVADIGGNTWTFWQQVSEDVELPSGWREIRPEPAEQDEPTTTTRASNG